MTRMKLNLKRIRVEDSEAITNILTKSFNYDTQLYFGEGAEDGPKGYDSGEIANKVLNDGSHSYLVYTEDCELAFISVDINKREVRYFCVLPKYIGQGYGKKIWSQMEELYGNDDWIVETPSYSISNHYFYEKLGFIKTGEKSYGENAKSFMFKK